jgi:hypothetical protein
MAPKPKKEDNTKYQLGDFGNSLYTTNTGNTKEYLQVLRKTRIPGVQKLTGKVYEVPKGSMKTAKAERGKTATRATNVAKRAEVTAARKVATKKLAKSTAQAERGKTAARTNSVAKRKAVAKEAARKPKKLY